jgi:hypothetical protein
MAASGSDKAKLIIVGAILIVAVGWIAYYTLGQRGPGRGMSKAEADRMAAEAADEQKKLDEEAAKAPPAIKRMEKAGS